jgi:hypothetical protein
VTIYQCSECGKPHDTSEPACPQTIVVPLAPPLVEDEALPSWKRRHVCPQCPRELQPRDGFDVVSFQEHVFSHSVSALRDAAQDATQYRESLDAIDRLLREESLVAWPEGFRLHVQHQVDVAIRRFDEAYWERRKAELRAPKPSDGAS